ncbi:hypothetical protein [Ferruginibacter sp.]|uniref:hypothetical protein n=1 Tax=Ferruginibacter sp. TaxID=1940288 RepID=UPI00374D6846
MKRFALTFAQENNMQSTMVIFNLLRRAVLLLGIWTFINGITGYFNNRSFIINDNRSNLFIMICCVIHLLSGLLLYFSKYWFSRVKDMRHNIKDLYTRFLRIEHLTMLILASFPWPFRPAVTRPCFSVR